MMFKGTEHLKPGEFSRIIAEEGGRENAFTGSDYTTYFETLEKSRLPIAFRLEAERMRRLQFDEEEFRKEVQVVMEERRLRTEDKPENQVYERFMHTAFGDSPYGWPVIGWMKDLESLKLENLRSWYRRWYAPNNATLVVAGDVDPEEVFRLAQEHFGQFEAEQIEPPATASEPAQTETRRLKVALPAKVPYLLMGYHVPTLPDHAGPDWEPFALDMLANLLSGGDSARLPSRLVRGSQVAVQASAGYDWNARLRTMLLIDANPAPGHDVHDVEQAIIAELEQLRSTPVSDAELERVKTQVVASNIYGRDSVFYQAMRLGEMVTVGLQPELVDQYVERVRAVTAEQVQAVAQKYLVPERLTVAWLDPLPITDGKPVQQPGGPHDDVR